jgi:tRNA A37 threonylcarbamoyladenosine dehydratase
MEQRLLDINPALDLTVLHEFLHPEASTELVASAHFDFVLDCIDSLAPKVHLIAAAHSMGVKVVSSMGAGGRLNPAAIQVGRCPLSWTADVATGSMLFAAQQVVADAADIACWLPWHGLLVAVLSRIIY